MTSSSSEHRPRRQSKSWIQVLGLLPAGVVLFWLSLSSTPLSVTGALSVGAIAICGWKRLRTWSVWLSAPAALAVGTTAPHREELGAAARGRVRVARRAVDGTVRRGVRRQRRRPSALRYLRGRRVHLLAGHRADHIRSRLSRWSWRSSPSQSRGCAFGRAGSMALVGLLRVDRSCRRHRAPCRHHRRASARWACCCSVAHSTLVSDRLLVAVHSWMCRGLQSRRRRE